MFGLSINRSAPIQWGHRTPACLPSSAQVAGWRCAVSPPLAFLQTCQGV